MEPLFHSIARAFHTDLPFLVGGDFNAYHPSWNNPDNPLLLNKRTANGNALYACAAAHDLTLLNTLHDSSPVPTHLGSDSVLDLTFLSDSALCESFEVLAHSLFDSDHLATLCTLQSDIPQRNNSTTVERHQWRCKEASEEVWASYRAQLDQRIANEGLLPLLARYIRMFENTHWQKDALPGVQLKVDELWEQLHKLIMEAAEATVGTKIIKPQHKFWFVNPHVQSLLKTKQERRHVYLRVRIRYREIARKYYNSSPEVRQRPPLAEEWASINSLLQQAKHDRKVAGSEFTLAIRRLRSDNWSELIQKLHNPDEKNQVQWKIFNRTLGTKHSDLGQIKDPQGSLPSNLQHSLNNLAQYFASISTQQSIPSSERVAQMSHLTASEFRSSLAQRPDHAWFQSASQFHAHNNEPISYEDVKSFCIHIPTNTALGWDFFAPHFLKRGTEALFRCLHQFFLITFKLGVLPSDWLRSNIFSMHKSGDKHLPENYRPISLTPVALRLYERLLLPKIWHILDTNQIIHPFQAGFRKNHGTLDCLYWLTQRINRTFLRKRPARVKPFLPVVFLDLKKAFDKINISIVLRKLYESGIRGSLLHFFPAFLSNRSIRAIHFDDYSEWYGIDTGTPQGSVLGPIIFSIYINDLIRRLVNLNNGIQPMGYADDISLVPTNPLDPLETTIDHLQQSLDVCSTWAKENFMTFSKDKSNLLCFRNTPHLDPFTSDKLSHLKLSGYQLDRFPLTVVDSYKYLGIKYNAYVRQLFTSHWDDVIRSVEHRAFQVSRAIDPYTTPIAVGIQLVVSIIRSKIGYSLSLISSSRKAVFTKLQSLVAKPLKKVLGLPRSASTLATLAECGISSIDVWRDKLTLQLAHRISTLSPTHESSIQFYQHDYNHDHQQVQSTRSYKGLIESLGSRVQALEGKLSNHNTQWNLNDHKAPDRRELKLKELELSHTQWINSNTCLALQALKPLHIEAIKKELYIVHDKPHISRLRARFRFNVAKTNQILFKYKQRASPNCPFCRHAIESREHILMECPEYQLERLALEHKLQRELQLNNPLTLNVILGDFRGIACPSQSLLDILAWTGNFIEFVVETRQLV